MKHHNGNNYTTWSYRVILIIYKIYTLNVVAEPLTSLAPFLLLRAHCCRDFCLEKENKTINTFNLKSIHEHGNASEMATFSENFIALTFNQNEIGTDQVNHHLLLVESDTVPNDRILCHSF